MPVIAINKLQSRNEISPFRALTPSLRIAASVSSDPCRNEISPFRALTPPSFEGSQIPVTRRNEISPFRTLTYYPEEYHGFYQPVEMKLTSLEYLSTSAAEQMAHSDLNAEAELVLIPIPREKSISSTKKAPQGFFAFLSFNLAYNFNSNF